MCCELILESPGRERSKSDQEEAGSPPVFVYKVFHIMHSSKKFFSVIQQLGDFFARVFCHRKAFPPNIFMKLGGTAPRVAVAMSLLLD